MWNVGQPCDCLICQAAGSTALRVVVVPGDGPNAQRRQLHGEELKRWYCARDEALAKMRAALGKPGRHGRMERLVERTPLDVTI